MIECMTVGSDLIQIRFALGHLGQAQAVHSKPTISSTPAARTTTDASATALADQLNLDFALINRKRRRDIKDISVPTVPPTPSGSDTGSHHEDEDDESHAWDTMELLVGDVKGRVAILIDDMIDTGHTVRLAAGVLQKAGASAVYALISHGLLSEATMENLRDLPLQKLVVTNSIDQTDRVEACGGMLDTIDIAPVIAESIRRTHNG